MKKQKVIFSLTNLVISEIPGISQWLIKLEIYADENTHHEDRIIQFITNDDDLVYCINQPNSDSVIAKANYIIEFFKRENITVSAMGHDSLSPGTFIVHSKIPQS